MKDRSDGFFVIPLVFAVVVFITGGYFLFKNWELERKNIDDTESSVSDPVDKNTPSSSSISITGRPQAEIADIEWYTHHDELGFSFQVPKGWDVVEGYGDDYTSFDI